jgi:hypothetical protein
MSQMPHETTVMRAKSSAIGDQVKRFASMSFKSGARAGLNCRLAGRKLDFQRDRIREGFFVFWSK